MTCVCVCVIQECALWAAVIKMEGGTEDDLLALEKPVDPIEEEETAKGSLD